MSGRIASVGRNLNWPLLRPAIWAMPVYKPTECWNYFKAAGYVWG